ncbi:hypothetical protein ACMDCT_15495 [Halomonadaceae bacterium KBTZ08]
MAIILLGSGLAGALLIYIGLVAIKENYVSKGVLTWLVFVAVPALLFSLCAKLIVEYFHNEVSGYLVFVLLPIYVLGVEPGYHLIGRKMYVQQSRADYDE